MTTLILVPTRMELTHLLPQGEPVYVDGLWLHQERNRVWVISGIGPAATALTTQLAIQRFTPSGVMVVGIAGAFHQAGIPVGTLVSGKSETFADLGYRDRDGIYNLDQMNLPMLPLADQDMGCRFPLHHLNAPLLQTDFITVSTITNSHEEADLLYRSFAAGVENMEGAAAAMVCARARIPLASIRAVSNHVGPRDPKSWQIKEPLKNLKALLNEQEDWVLSA